MLMTRVLSRENLLLAHKKVVSNKEAPGIDGITVEELWGFCQKNGIVPSEKLASVVIFEDVYKISYEVILAPVSILLIYFLKVGEKVDIYDELYNLNPFRIDTNYKISANKFVENFTSTKRGHDG